MQTSLLSANTYFNPMITRVQTVEGIQPYRDPRRNWSLLDAETATDTTNRKIPTESDDREDYSSDPEKAEDEVDGASHWRGGGATRKPSEEDGGFELTSATAVIMAKPLRTSTVSLGDHVVLVAAEPVSDGAVGVDFRLQNDEDEKTVEEGLKEIENAVQKLDLDEEESTPPGSVGRGPNGGRASKVDDNQLRGGQGGRRQEPNESSDVDCRQDQPKKFYRPNEETVHNDGCGYYSVPTIYGPRMQIQGQHPCYDQPTGYSFPSQILEVTQPYFATTCQGVVPIYPQPQAPPAQWISGYPSSNRYISDGNQPEFRPFVLHQPSPYPQNRYSSETVHATSTFNQYPDADIDNANQRLTHQQQYIATPSPMPIYQPPRQDQIVSNMRTIPAVPGIHDPLLIHDTFYEAPVNSALSVVPVTTHSDLDEIFEWVLAQPETYLPSTYPTEPHPSSPPSSWEQISSAPSVTLGVTPSPYSDPLPVSSPGQCLPPRNEFAPILNQAASSYNQLPTASSPSGVNPKSASSSSGMDTSPRSTVSVYDPADDKGTHNSPGSDHGANTTSGMSWSDHGSVANSPSSVSDDVVTILSGDEMAQITEAQAIADSFQELALVSKDSQGDTPLHVAMIDDQWYLAEAILRRLIRLDLLKQVINIRNKLQQTPLCLAVICNQPQIVQTLIENGADVNVHIKASDDYLGTKFCQPLHLASSRGHLWKLTLKKLLRANNIDLDAFNSDGKSAMHCAIEGHGRQFKDATIDCKDTLRMLAERGANLNQPDCGHEKTPLHYAIERRNVELVSRLLVLALNFTPDRDPCSVAKMLEAKTGNGNTALHLAASVDMDTVEHKKLIQQLMSKGADPSSKNSDGFLPRELTKNRAIVELLKGRTASGRSPNFHR